MENLTELLEEQVKDLYSAEVQISKALPKLAKKAMAPELRDAFNSHLEETLGQIERVLKVCEIMNFNPKGKVCAATKGLVEEGKEVLEEDGKSAVIDAALVAAAQRIEHYEIAAYGTVKKIAELLGKDDVVELFDETLAEETACDEKLTAIVEESIYPNAPKSAEDGEAEGEEDEDESEESGTGKKTASGKTKPPSKAAASKGGKMSGKKTAKAR